MATMTITLTDMDSAQIVCASCNDPSTMDQYVPGNYGWICSDCNALWDALEEDEYGRLAVAADVARPPAAEGLI